MDPGGTARVRARIAVEGRPSSDDACAGCAQLVPLRALRRAGLSLQGGLGCDPGAPRAFVPATGRWAAVAGAGRVLDRGARPLLESAVHAGATLVVVMDDAPARAWFVEALLSRAGARVVRGATADVGAWDERVAAALAAGPGTALLSVQPCTRGAARSAPAVVAPSRCNRCGACLSLGCPAVSDPGGEAMWVDPGVCTGCRICLPLCRGRALGVHPG